MKLWRCPDCGNQKRAPGKPRRNDVRRFCLPCSQRTGYMVERVCPTLEKKRTKVKAKVSAKGKAVRAKATAVRKIKEATIEKTFYIDGVDVRPILKRMQTILKRYQTHPKRFSNDCQMILKCFSNGSQTISNGFQRFPTVWPKTENLHFFFTQQINFK